MNLFPLVTWDRCDNRLTDGLLVAWEHWLGPCNRPFGVQSFVLSLGGEPVSVAVSASTVNKRCGGYARKEVVELARLCSHPDHRDLTRVSLRLWRVTAARAWEEYWPVRAYVSYANAIRHKGDIYRFDGWEKVGDVPGGVAGGNWGVGKAFEAKSVWVFRFSDPEVRNGRGQVAAVESPREEADLPFPDWETDD